MLTVKSDDVAGREQMYESIIKGRNALEAGMPVSFDVLVQEVRGLGMDLRLEKAQRRLGRRGAECRKAIRLRDRHRQC